MSLLLGSRGLLRLNEVGDSSETPLGGGARFDAGVGIGGQRKELIDKHAFDDAPEGRVT